MFFISETILRLVFEVCTTAQKRKSLVLHVLSIHSNLYLFDIFSHSWPESQKKNGTRQGSP